MIQQKKYERTWCLQHGKKLHGNNCSCDKNIGNLLNILNNPTKNGNIETVVYLEYIDSLVSKPP